MKAFTGFCLFLSLMLPPTVLLAAESPLATVQTAITKVMAIIDDTSLQGENSKAEKVKRIEVIVDDVFDYDKLAR